MTHINRRFALGYLLLVIVPIIGLGGILRSGGKLTAPPAIGGVWKMHVRAESLAFLPCARAFTMLRDVEFTVSQSGKDFTLNFANWETSAASGTIDGTRIKANILASTQRAAQAGCSGGRVLSLTASLDSEATPKLILGVLALNDCATCAPAEFRAVREADDGK